MGRNATIYKFLHSRITKRQSIAITTVHAVSLTSATVIFIPEKLKTGTPSSDVTAEDGRSSAHASIFFLQRVRASKLFQPNHRIALRMLQSSGVLCAPESGSPAVCSSLHRSPRFTAPEVRRDTGGKPCYHNVTENNSRLLSLLVLSK